MGRLVAYTSHEVFQLVGLTTVPNSMHLVPRKESGDLTLYLLRFLPFASVFVSDSMKHQIYPINACGDSTFENTGEH